MSQSASGDNITQISVEASQNVNIIVNGQIALQLLSPAYPRPLPPGKREPIDLLKAAHALIPFVGRKDSLQDFIDWCSGASPVSVRILVGQGGAGKTRFAYELYVHTKKQPEWSAYFVRFLKNEAKEVNLWGQVKSKNTLIIVDYASDLAKPLADLLRSLADLAPVDRTIRVLLLARTASWDHGWLASVSSERTGQDVERYFQPHEPMHLPLFTPEESRTIFAQTLSLASEYMGKPVPAEMFSATFADSKVPERLADPLTLMMAALIALDSDTASALLLSRLQLAYKVSRKLVADRMKSSVEDHQDLFLHMAAYATLCGGLNEEEALRALEQESDHTHLGRVADPKVFLNKLQAWLPGEMGETWVGGIKPDIVGEAFILGEGQHVYLREAAITVLRAVRQRRAPSILTIVHIAQDFSLLSLDGRVEPLGWLTKLIEQGEADKDLVLLSDISNAIPQSSVVLREIALRISIVLCARMRMLLKLRDKLASVEMQSTFASALNILANRQGAAGRREDALVTAAEVNDLYNELAVLDQDTFQPYVAMSVNNLANKQYDIGNREAALKSAEEAVRLGRELLLRNHDAFLPDLALSLNNLSLKQGATGDVEAALKTAEEAATLYHELNGINPNIFMPYLAAALANLAKAQSEAMRAEAAVVTAEQAVNLCRKLAEDNRDAYLPTLAMALSNLANMLAGIGQWDMATSTAKKAIVALRELVEHNRNAFLHNLAMSLYNLAHTQSSDGDLSGALSAAMESVDLYRELVKGSRDTFLPYLGMSLVNLIKAQSDLQQLEEALGTAAEAIEIGRELTAFNRDTFLPNLALALNNLSWVQREAGLRESALVTATEACKYYRELTNLRREMFLPYLAMSLNNLTAAQVAIALTTAEQTAEVYRELAGRDPTGFESQLAKTLGEVGGLLNFLGSFSKAAQSFAEGIRILLPRVKKDPVLHLGLTLGLIREYLLNSQSAREQPDNTFMREVTEIVGPYLENKGD